MNIGTKSVLIGVHQFLLHPLLLACGWWKAYGFRRVPIGNRWVIGYNYLDQAFNVEDGCGPKEARRYLSQYPAPEHASLFRPALWVAFFVHDLGYFGKPNMDGVEGESHPELGARIMRALFGEPWGDLVLLHSRYYAKKLGCPVSPLCFADKWVIVLEPALLYIPRAWLSGELSEFLENAHRRAQVPGQLTDRERADLGSRNAWRWQRGLKSYMRRWIEEHENGRDDNWTRVRHQTALEAP